MKPRHRKPQGASAASAPISAPALKSDLANKGAGRWKSALAAAWLPAACALAYGLLKIPALRPQVSAENIYFYMGRLITEGKLPYRDFFYSGTPLLPYLLAVPALLAPHSIVAFKLAPLAAASLTVGFFAAALQRAHGRGAAWAGVLLLLCSESYIKSTSHATGINLAMLGAWAAAYFALAGRPRWSGAALALGVGGKLLACTAAPALLYLVWYTTSRERRKAALIEWCVAAGAVAALVFVPFVILAPHDMYNGMVQYHLHKVSRPERDAAVWLTALSENAALFVVALLALGVWAWQRRRAASPLVPFCGAFMVLHCWFLLAQKRMWAFYFDPLFPACAALGAYLCVAARAQLRSRRWSWGLPLIVTAALAAAVYPALRHDLDHEARYLKVAAPMAAYLSSRAPTGAALFGDSVSTSLLAIMTGLPIAGDEADTNGMRWTSGAGDLPAVLDRLSAYPVTYVVANYVPSQGPSLTGIGVAGFPEFQRLVTGRPFQTFHNPGKGTFVIYELSRKPR